MTLPRRTVLVAGSASTLAAATAMPARRSDEPVLDPVPPLPARPPAGKPGEFDFLNGRWRVRHWRRATPDAAWDRFDGEATCWTVLAGVGSVEELRIPARQFSGMGLRLLDLKQQQWSDFWVNARSGALAAPGQPGGFEQGVGFFWSDDPDNGRTTTWAGLWDRITARSCRWRQVSSADGGQTWVQHWVMHWRRA